MRSVKRSGTALPRLYASLSLAALLFASVAGAQRTQSEPATDSSTQASPIATASKGPVVDASQQASPIRPQHSGPVASIAPHTTLHLRLASGIDSGHLKNGQTVRATLTEPVTLSPKGTLPAGTPAELTVVETLPAGRIYAAGELSLQVLQVGPHSVYTDTLTFRGQPGHKDLPDSAPAVGTDAGLASGAALTFHVLPPPIAVTGPPSGRFQPGAVNGVASGGPPPPGSSAASRPSSGNAGKAGTARTVQPAENTPGRAQNLGEPSPAPNQPAPPENSTPEGSTQPH